MAEFPKLLNQKKREEAFLKTKGGKTPLHWVVEGERDGRRRRNEKKEEKCRGQISREREFEKWDIFRRWLFFEDQHRAPKIPPQLPT